jgi:hypothetical protein
MIIQRKIIVLFRQANNDIWQFILLIKLETFCKTQQLTIDIEFKK